MRKTTIVLAVLVAGFAFLTVWTWKKLNFSPISETSLRLSLDNVVESLDPAKAYSDDSLLVSAQVLEPLYQYHYLKRPYEIQPLVADGLPQILNKGKLLQIKIKKGIFYHPHAAFSKPRELEAKDFVIQFKRMALDDLKSPGRGLFNGLIEGFEGYNKLVGGDWTRIESTPLAGIEVKDKYTLVINLTKTEPNMIYYLALNFLSPVPWELVQHSKNNLDHVLIGTGPYHFKGYNGQYFDLERFRGYREDFYPTSGDRYANVQNLLNSSKEKIPFIDNVRFFITTAENDTWQKFFNHEIDLLTVPKTFIPRLYDTNGELNPEIKKNGVELKHFPILANRWLAFNMKDPLVGKNEFLRRAIAYSINYEDYIQVISQNTNLRANSILVPGIAGYLPAKDFRFKHDPALAKEYLKMAGFTEKNMPTIVYSTRGNQGINILEADFIKSQLEKVGLKVEVQVLPFSDFLRKGRAGELMFFTDNWLFDYPDAENILQLLVSTNFPGVNKSAYNNPEIDDLYQRLKETMNPDQKDKIVHQMEEIIFQDLPWIPMMYESSFVLQYPEIKNFRKSSIIRNYVKYLKIEK
ncbi:ABC transporter substrate-binding protein [Peredibacter starrii]|uniref:ABC transporter substrate-binding protein n=1 Tax=Peredibacter starrii TaxID=28202 RepID=A0AAX4HST7_9BACT|nr:ABC transporter substrate-binding protein [Peredibacter starrii]WPU66030.1 ABC transporter substrate-binding protein [Peredibacter starrii]